MTAAAEIDRDWVGRVARLLVLFRLLVLLVTVLWLPAHERTAAVLAVVLAAAALSYLPLGQWHRVEPRLGRRPYYAVAEIVISMALLGTAGAHSAFFYYTLGTAALAGLVYGVDGAPWMAVALVALYELIARLGLPHMLPIHDGTDLVLAPILYPVAVALGAFSRRVIDRGAATEELLRERTDSLAAERERLGVARELHDSLAKTVEGLAMTAMVLQRRCDRDPASAKELAAVLAADAQQAALEARELMNDLRTAGDEIGFLDAMRGRAAVLADRAGVAVDVHAKNGRIGIGVSSVASRELMRILGEAVINSARHGGATHVDVDLVFAGDALTMNIADDGTGFAAEPDLDALAVDGHYGLIGMRERAESVGGSLSTGPSDLGGACVTIVVPLGSEPVDRAAAAEYVGLAPSAAVPTPPAGTATGPVVAAMSSVTRP